MPATESSILLPKLGRTGPLPGLKGVVVVNRAPGPYRNHEVGYPPTPVHFAGSAARRARIASLLNSSAPVSGQRVACHFV